MARHPQQSVSQRLALATLALVACLRPAWGGPTSVGASPVAVEVPACCREPESCCGEGEHRESGPALLPECCGVDTPPSTPREPQPLPRLSVPDPTKRVLRELTRALQQIDLSGSSLQGSGARHDGAGLSPPDRAREPSSKACHWLTDREMLAALAMLSVARL